MRLEYELRQDPFVGKILNNLTSIAHVVARPSPSKLPGFLSNSTETDFSRKELGKFERHDGSSEKDANSCCFSGATYVNGGRIVVADWNNSCLKLLNNKGLLVQRLELSNNPWDVKPHPDIGVIVTVPGEQKIYMVRFDKGTLELDSYFDTDCECWGLAVLEDKLAVTCDPWSKTSSVKIYSMTGKLLSFYQKESSGAALFAYPSHITSDTYQQILYVTDARKHMVIAVTLDGCVLFRYSNDYLSGPSGVATDSQGNIYVCGKESQNIHQITKNGELIRIIATAENVGTPRAISMHPEGDSLLITDVSNEGCDDVITVAWE